MTIAFAPHFTVEQLLHKDTWYWDLDRTVVDTNRGFAAYSGTLQRKLLELEALPEDALRAALEEASARLGTIFFARRLDLVTGLSTRYGQDVNIRFAVAAADAEAAYARHMRLPKTIAAIFVMLRLQGKRLIGFTGGSPNYTANNCGIARLARYFTRVYCGAPHPFEDLPDSGLPKAKGSIPLLIPMPPNAKKSPIGFNFVLEHEGDDRSMVMTIGDSPIDDVGIAESLGMNGALVRWFVQPPLGNVVPSLTLESPQDLLLLLQARQPIGNFESACSA